MWLSHTSYLYVANNDKLNFCILHSYEEFVQANIPLLATSFQPTCQEDAKFLSLYPRVCMISLGITTGYEHRRVEFRRGHQHESLGESINWIEAREGMRRMACSRHVESKELALNCKNRLRQACRFVDMERENVIASGWLCRLLECCYRGSTNHIIRGNSVLLLIITLSQNCGSSHLQNPIGHGNNLLHDPSAGQAKKIHQPLGHHVYIPQGCDFRN